MNSILDHTLDLDVVMGEMRRMKAMNISALACPHSVPLGRDCAGVREDLLENEMQLSGEAVAQVAQRGGHAPSLQTAKVKLDGAVSTDGAVGVPVQCRGLDWVAFTGPF